MTNELIGAFLQGGALFMVAYVLWVMFSKHWPAQVTQFTTTIKEQSDKIEKLTCTFLDALEKERIAFREELRAQREENATKHTEVLKSLERITRVTAYLCARVGGSGSEVPDDIKRVLEM